MAIEKLLMSRLLPGQIRRGPKPEIPFPALTSDEYYPIGCQKAFVGAAGTSWQLECRRAGFAQIFFLTIDRFSPVGVRHAIEVRASSH
jgi:hypothetical protein